MTLNKIVPARKMNKIVPNQLHHALALFVPQMIAYLKIGAVMAIRIAQINLMSMSVLIIVHPFMSVPKKMVTSFVEQVTVSP